MNRQEAARRIVAKAREAMAYTKATTEGDLALILARLRDPAAELTMRERELVADLLEGKRKLRPMHRPPDPKLPIKKRQAAQMYLIMTEGLGLVWKEALYRLGVHYKRDETAIGKWINAEKKRVGPEAWASMKAKAPGWLDGWRDCLEEDAARLLFGPRNKP